MNKGLLSITAIATVAIAGVLVLEAPAILSKAGLRSGPTRPAVTLSSLLGSKKLKHYEYVCPDGFIYVYDIDSNFQLVKTIHVPTSAGTRGVVASAITGMLYISYGGDGLSTGSMLEYDLIKDRVVWTEHYPFGIDSMAVSPDGKTIYMPTGELNSSGTWEVINAASGKVADTINTSSVGPHNTVVSADGTHVYLGPRSTNYLIQADASTHRVIREIGPVRSAFKGPGIRPFTINGADTLAFMNVTGVPGFQVGDLATGKILYDVPIPGLSDRYPGAPNAPSHGISLSPEDKELYVLDVLSSSLHIYDICCLPASPPKHIAVIALTHQITGEEHGCAYDCTKGGWLHHSRDGRYVFVGDSGDVANTASRQIVAYLPALSDTRNFIEIDFQDGVPEWAMTDRTSKSTPRALGPLPDGDYVIRNSATNLVLDDPFSSTTSGQQIIEWNWNNTANQKWHLSYRGNGYYTIQNSLSGLLLTDPGNSSGKKVPLQQQTIKADDSSQLWHLARTGTSFVITSKASRTLGEDPASSSKQGAGIILSSEATATDHSFSWTIGS